MLRSLSSVLCSKLYLMCPRSFTIKISCLNSPIFLLRTAVLWYDMVHVVERCAVHSEYDLIHCSGRSAGAAASDSAGETSNKQHHHSSGAGQSARSHGRRRWSGWLNLPVTVSWLFVSYRANEGGGVGRECTPKPRFFHQLDSCACGSSRVSIRVSASPGNPGNLVEFNGPPGDFCVRWSTALVSGHKTGHQIAYLRNWSLVSLCIEQCNNKNVANVVVGWIAQWWALVGAHHHRLHWMQ